MKAYLGVDDSGDTDAVSMGLAKACRGEAQRPGLPFLAEDGFGSPKKLSAFCEGCLWSVGHLLWALAVRLALKTRLGR